MPTFLEKGRIATVWQRLTANRWTVAFVVALLVQVCSILFPVIK